MCGRCVVHVLCYMWYFVLVVVQVDSFDCLHAPINSINVSKDTISLLLNCTHTEIHFILLCVLIFHYHSSRVWCVCWIKKCHSGWNPCTTNKFFIILPRQNSTNWKKTCTPASPTATTPTTTWPWPWKENWTTQWWNWNEPFGNRWTNQFGQWVHAKSFEELEK